MQTLEEAREHCRFVGKDIEKMVADGEDLGARFEGTQMLPKSNAWFRNQNGDVVGANVKKED